MSNTEQNKYKHKGYIVCNEGFYITTENVYAVDEYDEKWGLCPHCQQLLPMEAIRTIQKLAARRKPQQHRQMKSNQLRNKDSK